ncbi:MAG TPA: hypothetical protein VFT64_00935 [Rickettsiales bacterium]|nr:hypothetical protein [Rickettsiales bacterium]
MAVIDIDLGKMGKYDAFVAELVRSFDVRESTPGNPNHLLITPKGSTTPVGSIEKGAMHNRLRYDSDQDAIAAAVLVSHGKEYNISNDAARIYFAIREREVNDRVVGDGMKGPNPEDPLKIFYRDGTLYVSPEYVNIHLPHKNAHTGMLKTAEELADKGGMSRRQITTDDITTLTNLQQAHGRDIKLLTYKDSGGQDVTVMYDRGKVRDERVLAVYSAAGGRGYVNQRALNDYGVQIASGKGELFPSGGGNSNGNNDQGMSDNTKHGLAAMAVAGAAVAATTWASRTQRDRQETAAMEGRPPERRGGMLQFVKVASVALATTALLTALDAGLNKGRAFDSVKNTLSR